MTKVSMPIIGWVSEILGWMINVIYSGLELIGITNIGLSIILFTLVVYLLMTPLQIKQQKFSKLNAVMQPEIQKIQKKYNGKKDQDSMMKQNEEISAVYQKYGVSPTGSCVQLLVQMPVLLALYQVIYHIPGYISGVRNVFTGLTAKIMSVDGFGSIISQFLTELQVHDELLIETAKEEVEQVSAILEREMRQAAVLSVPLEVDMHTGENWYEAK